MTLHPAPPDSGIRFRRRDLAAGEAEVIVGQAAVATGLAQEPVLVSQHGTAVGGLRCLMASLAAAGIDNAVVELDGPEVPAMDGSAAPFMRLIECAGLISQPLPRRHLRLTRSLVVEQGDGWVRLGAAADRDPQLALSDDRPAPRKTVRHVFCMNAFAIELAAVRRACFETEFEHWRQHGRARGASQENTIIIAESGPSNDAARRYSATHIRRRLVDFVGDLALLGIPVHADLSAHRYDVGLGIAMLESLRGLLDETTVLPVNYPQIAADAG